MNYRGRKDNAVAEEGNKSRWVNMGVSSMHILWMPAFSYTI